MRVDLHTHTCYSFDTFTPMEKTIEAIQKSGVDCVAVTDHNEIDGAFKMQKIAPFKVIVGEEIRTADGEIIGLFLKEKIPPKLSALETIRRIKAQGGLVYLPHPFCFLMGAKLKNHLVWQYVREGLIDIVEVYNAAAIFLMSFKTIHDLMAGTKLGKAASTDGHTPEEFVGACVDMADFDGPQDFLAKLKAGRLVMKPGFLYSTFKLIYNYLIRTKLLRLPHGAELEAKWEKKLAS